MAAKYGIARELQDKMAVSSHQRAAKARDTGRFKEEIVPVKTMWKDPKTGTPPLHAPLLQCVQGHSAVARCTAHFCSIPLGGIQHSTQDSIYEQLFQGVFP